MKRYAVLMGDLVGSEAAEAPDLLHAGFNAAINRENAKWRKQIAAPLTITLGDEFQGLLPSLKATLPVLRDLRLDLLDSGIDCRFAVGTVDLKTPLNTKNAWNMMGRGLAQTREKLNERKSGLRYRFAFPEHAGTEILLEALGAGLALVEKGWTAQQLDDIRASLAGLTAAEIGRKRNVSAHSVYKVRSSGAFDTYLLQWQAVQETFERLDRQYGMA